MPHLAASAPELFMQLILSQFDSFLSVVLIGVSCLAFDNCTIRNKQIRNHKKKFPFKDGNQLFSTAQCERYAKIKSINMIMVAVLMLVSKHKKRAFRSIYEQCQLFFWFDSTFIS